MILWNQRGLSMNERMQSNYDRDLEIQRERFEQSCIENIEVGFHEPDAFDRMVHKEPIIELQPLEDDEFELLQKELISIQYSTDIDNIKRRKEIRSILYGMNGNV